MKTYVVKTYYKNGTYKETINPDSILNEIAFSWSLDWWQWQLTLQTNYPFADTSYIWWELIKVWLYDEFHVDWKQIYYGYISKIERRAEQSREYTTFTCLWLWSLAKWILYTNGSYSQTCYNMMVNILTHLRWFYPSITKWNIANVNTTTQAWTWNYNNEFDCFKTIAEAIWYNWTIDMEWKLNMFLPTSNNPHLVSMSNEVMSIDIVNTIEEMVNYYQLARNGWTVQTYQNTTSQSTYGFKMKYESNTNLNSAQTQNDYWNNYIAHYKNPKQTMQIILNAEYPYENIQPWHRITILNTDLSTLKNLVISKIDYKTDQAIITIDYKDTLWKVIS